MRTIVQAVLAGVMAGAVFAGPAAAGPGAVPEKESGPPENSVRLPMQVPLFSERFSAVPIAVVNGEEITLEELADAVASAHEGRKPGATASKIGYSEILDRLINVRLFAQEARSMGMDELPEVRSAIDTFAQAALRQHLMREVTKNAVPDESVVSNYYREAVRSWKLRSVLFGSEEDARALEQRLRDGGDFAALAAEAVKAGKASGGEKTDVVKPASLLPQVREAVAKMKPGQISPVVAVGSGKKAGFTVVRFEEELFPDDPAEKEKARKRALEDRLKQEGMAYRADLYKKKVKINKKLVASVDYEANKGRLEKLLADKRALATIAGDKPVTVDDLTAALKEHFYHGMDIAAEGKKLNRKKQEMLEQVIDKRLLRGEALARGIDKSPVYRAAIKENELSLLFGTFLQRAVAPGLTVSGEETRAYYQAHASEYVYPEMMRISSLVFTSVAAAEKALEKLNKGADYRWMEENAEGRVPKDAKGLYEFGEAPLTVKDLPEDVRDAVSGAKTGDYRLAAGPGGYSYVLLVRDEVPSRQLPFEEVQQEVSNKVLNQKLAAEAKVWAEKLRAAAELTVFLTGADTHAAAAKK